MMSNYDPPIIEPTIDYTKVPPINQKRTISFVNHFIIHTVTFLNKFALSCEEKLFEFENKLQRVEASLAILESRISSIPGLDQEPERNGPATSSEIPEPKSEEKSEDKHESRTEKIDEPDTGVPEEPKPQPTELIPISKDPRFERFFKMMQFGVPKPGVKQKMEQEGLDSSILDDPQQLVPKVKLENEQ